MHDWAVKLFLPYLVFLGIGNSTVSLYLKIWPDKKGEHEGWWLAEYCGEGVWFFFKKIIMLLNFIENIIPGERCKAYLISPFSFQHEIVVTF